MQKYCVLSLIRLIIGSAYTVYASEAATRGVLLKSVSLKISQNSKSFRLGTLWKVLSCEFCEIFKNAFFTEHLRTTASLACMTGLMVISLWKYKEYSDQSDGWKYVLWYIQEII